MHEKSHALVASFYLLFASLSFFQRQSSANSRQCSPRKPIGRNNNKKETLLKSFRAHHRAAFFSFFFFNFLQYEHFAFFIERHCIHHAMTSLPVLHLKATSRQNMKVTDDPYETTATLYTFLRSIPSIAERELAFQPFLDALHAAPSSGRGALLRKPNHRLVQVLETVAVDGVFCDTPRTIPALARHSDRWMRRLGYDGTSRVDSPALSAEPLQRRGADMADGDCEGRSSPLLGTPSPSPSPGQHVVRAADMHQYNDSYAAYEAQRALLTEKQDVNSQLAGHADRAGRRRRDEVEEPLQYSGSTQAPDDPPHEGAGQLYRSYLSAEVSALTAADGDVREPQKSKSTCGSRSGSNKTSLEDSAVEEAYDESAFNNASASVCVHPVLQLIARQVEQTVATEAAPDEALPSPPSAAATSSQTIDAAIKSKILRLTTHLDEAAEEISTAMHEKEQNEQVWSPYYSRLKTSITFVEELQQRLGSAISLYELQRYERETLQQAHVAVQMEALSLKLVLRDVRARLADAEEAAEFSSRDSIEDVELVRRLQEVLNAPQEEAEGMEE